MNETPPTPAAGPRVRLDRFDPSRCDRGRAVWVVALWMLVRWLFFDTACPWPFAVKRFWLRRFGARIGRGVRIWTRVYVHYPWRLDLGDHVWIGEGCRLLSFEWITIEAHTALAHGVFLAAGGHDLRSATFAPQNAPILLRSGCWIASRAFVGPGVTVGADAVVGAASVVLSDVEPGTIVVGNPARPLRRRVIDRP